MQITLIIALILACYAFVGYPLFLSIVSFFFSKKIFKKKRIDIPVSLIIAAYNEEDVIKNKLLNSLQLDYPSRNLEIIVASDGSTDKTDKIVESFKGQGVILNRVEGRKGKTEAQNQTVNIAKGEIIIFSDANAFYRKDAIVCIVQNFCDKLVGGVSGRLIYTHNNKPENDSESTYWNYENFLKEKESLLSSVIGANGSIYAIRKKLYTPLCHTLISDFVEPLKIIEKGYRFVFEKNAISYEEADSVSGAHAFNRKVRINIRTILGLLDTLKLLNIFKYGWVSIQYFSRKILRYIMPFLLILIFIVNIFLLDSCWWMLFFGIQTTFYTLGFLGYLKRSEDSQVKIVSLPWYFIWIHSAILTAYYQLIQGERKTTWETKRK